MSQVKIGMLLNKVIRVENSEVKIKNRRCRLGIRTRKENEESK